MIDTLSQSIRHCFYIHPSPVTNNRGPRTDGSPRLNTQAVRLERDRNAVGSRFGNWPPVRRSAKQRSRLCQRGPACRPWRPLSTASWVRVGENKTMACMHRLYPLQGIRCQPASRSPVASHSSRGSSRSRNRTRETSSYSSYCRS